MQLSLSTWTEVEQYLETSDTIIIPIGSMEQHGPTGLIGTDAICPEVIAKCVGDEHGVLIGPTFNVGCAQHHLGFPGTMTLRPSTMIAAIADWSLSLAKHGFKKLYWFNGHGGNTATIQAAFAEVYAQRSFEPAPARQPAFRMTVKNWWELPSVMAKCRELHPSGDGMHATASEVAVTYAAYPEQIRTRTLDPRIAPIGGFTDAEHYRANFPDGRIGSDPTQATVEAGEILIEVTAQALWADVQKFAQS